MLSHSVLAVCLAVLCNGRRQQTVIQQRSSERSLANSTGRADVLRASAAFLLTAGTTNAFIPSSRLLPPPSSRLLQHAPPANHIPTSRPGTSDDRNWFSARMMAESSGAPQEDAREETSKSKEWSSGEMSMSGEVYEEVVLPRHARNPRVNVLLDRAERLIRDVQTGRVDPKVSPPSMRGDLETTDRIIGTEDNVYAYTNVDLGAIEVIGFDYDYTLVSYKKEVLNVIYDLARTSLVEEMRYPKELLEDLPGYDPNFAVRGLAVDLETAWVCHLTYNYKVSSAFFGRDRVNQDEINRMYVSEKGGGSMSDEERKARFRPLNDLFSMVDACILADVVQFFKDKEIPFDPRSVANDVLQAVGKAHDSGDMHRAVAGDLEKYVEPDAKRHLRQMLTKLRQADKKMMLVSNSQFWYVDAGMRYVVGDDWRDFFEVVVAPAGKPAFYTQDRPFREVSTNTGRVKFKPITELVKGEVYCDGSVGELMKLTGWGYDPVSDTFDGSKILYLGDSLFADLVDARRYGWITGAIVREVRHETRVQNSVEWRREWFILNVLMHCLRLAQDEMGVDVASGEAMAKRQEPRSVDDLELLDALEGLATQWRTKAYSRISPQFGSIFRCPLDFGTSPSLFALCMRRHVDLYTSRVENFRLYSTDHRFYPTLSDPGNGHVAEAYSDNVLDSLI